MATQFPHGDVLRGKHEREIDSYRKGLLEELLAEYEGWHKRNMDITTCDQSAISEKVRLLNERLDHVNQPKYRQDRGDRRGFPAQAKIQSSVIEEFCCYLFKDLVGASKERIWSGSAEEAYQDLSFSPTSLSELECFARVYVKRQRVDFAIGRNAVCVFDNDGDKPTVERLFVPVVVVECKTYLPATMLDPSAYAAERIKRGNPHAWFSIVSERNALAEESNPHHTSIDQIYILRKERHSNNPPTRPVDTDVVWTLFTDVATHLSTQWWDPEKATERGTLI